MWIIVTINFFFRVYLWKFGSVAIFFGNVWNQRFLIYGSNVKLSGKLRKKILLKWIFAVSIYKTTKHVYGNCKHLDIFVFQMLEKRHLQFYKSCIVFWQSIFHFCFRDFFFWLCLKLKKNEKGWFLLFKNKVLIRCKGKVHPLVFMDQMVVTKTCIPNPKTDGLKCKIIFCTTQKIAFEWIWNTHIFAIYFSVW